MKFILAAALALVLGFVLGGLGPRADLRQAQKDLADARRRSDEGRAGAAVPMALGGLFAARDRASDRALARRNDAPLGAPAGPEPSPAPAAAAGTGDGEDGGTGDGGSGRRRGLAGLANDETFGQIKSAADLRAAQFRAAFLEEAHLDEAGVKAVDDVVAKMNEEFSREADAIAELIDRKGDKLAPRDMADIGVKLLEVYRKADDAMQGSLSPEAQAAADRTRFDLLTQVDVAAFRKLAEAAAKLERPPERLR